MDSGGVFSESLHLKPPPPAEPEREEEAPGSCRTIECEREHSLLFLLASSRGGNLTREVLALPPLTRNKEGPETLQDPSSKRPTSPHALT